MYIFRKLISSLAIVLLFSDSGVYNTIVSDDGIDLSGKYVTTNKVFNLGPP